MKASTARSTATSAASTTRVRNTHHLTGALMNLSTPRSTGTSLAPLRRRVGATPGTSQERS